MVLCSEYNWASLSKPGLVGCQAPIAVYVLCIYVYSYVCPASFCMYVCPIRPPGFRIYFSYENGCCV